MERLASTREAVARAQEVAERVALPMADLTDSGVWPAEALRAMQEAGLGGLVAPTDVGGAGFGLRALAEVCEAVGTACASTAICYGMHCVATAVIAAKATALQREEFLDPIVAGTHLSTLALSEPGTGAHFWLPQTQVRRSGDGFQVDGQKSFVTSGSRADSYVVSTAAADTGAPVGEFSFVVVPATSEGLTWLDDWDGLGMRGNSSRRVRLDSVRVPSTHLLGAVGDQMWYVFEVVAPYFLIAMAGTYLGVAQAALREGIDHLNTRRYSPMGRSLASQPVLQHRLGILWAHVERTRQLIYWAADEADSGRPTAMPALMAAKAEVADCAVTVANEVMTLVGGIGYRDRSPIERHLRDARAAHVMSPTTDILRTWIGRSLLDIPLLSE